MSKFIDVLGLGCPIIQAPMAGVQDSALCIAVSEAGGLGSLPCALLTPDEVLQESSKIRAATSNPFNLNFFCHTMPKADPSKMKEWLSLFAGDYENYGIPLETGLSGQVREPFSKDFADVLNRIKPPVVSFHFGLPEETLLNQVRNSGAFIISSATTLEEAQWLEERGVDAIIAQGVGAGGHRGMFLTDDLSTQQPTEALVKQLVDTVNCPVIAAGGIASSEQVQSYLEIGAEAVQVGTSYLLCTEAKTSAVHRKALEDQDGSNTVLTNIFSGRPARGITNKMINKLGAINPSSPSFPYAALASAPLRKVAESQGCSDFTPLWSGVNSSGCRNISAAEMTKSLSNFQY